MPPEKNVKSEAKALQEKNTAEAKKIISMLLPVEMNTLDIAGRSPTKTSTENNDSVDVDADERENPPIAIQKDAKQTKEKTSGTSRKSSRSLNSSASKTINSASSSKIRAKSSYSKNGSSGRLPKNETETVSKVKKTSAPFHYEIDCNRVRDSINVLDLQNYLKMQLKVNGKKTNLDDNVEVRCEDQKVVIKSKVFLPKRSLRFLSKNFLKKTWNIQVVSKNKCSYEYKYVGTV